LPCTGRQYCVGSAVYLAVNGLCFWYMYILVNNTNAYIYPLSIDPKSLWNAPNSLETL
jgi:hypothetical protein